MTFRHLCVPRSVRKGVCKGAMTGTDDPCGGSPASLTPCGMVSTSTHPLQSCLPGSALETLRNCGCLGIAQHPVREMRQDPVGALKPASFSDLMQEGCGHMVGLTGVPTLELTASLGAESVSAELGASSPVTSTASPCGGSSA